MSRIRDSNPRALSFNKPITGQNKRPFCLLCYTVLFISKIKLNDFWFLDGLLMYTSFKFGNQILFC